MKDFVIKQIRVVDDNPFQRRITEKYLTSRGIQVSTAGSGHEGLPCLKTHPEFVEALVADIRNMPNMDDFPMPVNCLPFSRAWVYKPKPSEFLKSTFRLKKQEDSVC